nr:MAG TPA: hypothetical protein [Caudoviricetes sp.]
MCVGCMVVIPIFLSYPKGRGGIYKCIYSTVLKNVCEDTPY